MSYTYDLFETLKAYDDVSYRVIGLKIESSDIKFEHKGTPVMLVVTDGTNSVNSFTTIISGNGKDLMSYFTVDAFTGISSPATIRFGYGDQYTEEIQNVNLQNIPALPPILNAVPHQTADNVWLQSITP